MSRMHGPATEGAATDDDGVMVAAGARLPRTRA
jgi:hypothetical protein